MRLKLGIFLAVCEELGERALESDKAPKLIAAIGLMILGAIVFSQIFLV